MPLRDHFRAPLAELHSWDELHGMWPAMIVRQLDEVLPEPYFAAPGIHLGTLYEIDVGTYANASNAEYSAESVTDSATVATYTAPQPTLTLEAQLPEQDVYEVRVYDNRRNRRLVAAIELVSPSNKDRPEARGAFTSKVATLLKQDVCVTIVDVISARLANLYAELMDFMQCSDPALDSSIPAMYAVSMRTRPLYRTVQSDSRQRLIDNWYHPLGIGERLPTLPLWLNLSLAVSLDLDASYEETCRSLRIR